MNLQQTVPSRSSSANGFNRRKTDRESGPRLDSKFQPGKTNSSRFINAGKEGVYENSSRDRLVYLSTCLIGHHVEVQVQDGSVFSGIFHATQTDQDFGLILKMARLIKDGHKNNIGAITKPPSRTLIIPANELVQVIAKDVPVTQEGLTNEVMHEKQELMIDSFISQSRNVDVGRELERWVPDNDDLGCPELDNIFDGPWNSRGSWDQFEVNETLFGVKSTFNEELYTTKLERGPKTRELEIEALRIAREIEGEDTRDLHLAEERGLHLREILEIDEETRFSSITRPVDDSGYEESEDIVLDTCNDETFGGSDKIDFAAQLSMDEVQNSQSSINNDVEKLKLPEEGDMSKSDDTWVKKYKDNSDKVGLSANATEYAPPILQEKGVILKSKEKTSSNTSPLSLDRGGAPSTSSSAPGLSPSSSMGSLTSEKSTLNPHAKEFRLNPNARSFKPNPTTLRPVSPVAAETSFYYPPNIPAMPHMHAMPVGITPTYPHQQVIYNPQAAPTPQPYFPPNAAPQMMYGHPRQFVYMPTYPPTEMGYKGRDF